MAREGAIILKEHGVPGGSHWPHPSIVIPIQAAIAETNLSGKVRSYLRKMASEETHARENYLLLKCWSGSALML